MNIWYSDCIFHLGSKHEISQIDLSIKVLYWVDYKRTMWKCLTFHSENHFCFYQSFICYWSRDDDILLMLLFCSAISIRYILMKMFAVVSLFFISSLLRSFWHWRFYVCFLFSCKLYAYHCLLETEKL